MSTSNVPSEARVGPDTRARLLEAAAEVFDEVGFRNATVQEICRRANANIAGVNYHFGDKLTLYAEVLRESHRRAEEKFGAEPDLDTGPPEERLQRFVRSFLRRIFDPDPPARHGRLMAREMVEPTGVLERLVREDMAPRHARLEAIVRELLGPRADEEQVRLCAISVVSQCLFYHHARPMLSLLHPGDLYDHTRIEVLTEHITGFCLAALRGLVAQRRGKR